MFLYVHPHVMMTLSTSCDICVTINFFLNIIAENRPVNWKIQKMITTA